MVIQIYAYMRKMFLHELDLIWMDGMIMKSINHCDC